MPKRYSKKQIKKLLHKKCFFCEESNYNLLDAHRVTPGSENGKYTNENMLTVCCKCHRLIHSGEITIEGKYNSTVGKMVHYFIQDDEFWKPE